MIFSVRVDINKSQKNADLGHRFPKVGTSQLYCLYYVTKNCKRRQPAMYNLGGQVGGHLPAHRHHLHDC